MKTIEEYEEDVIKLSEAILDGLNENPHLDARIIVGAISHALVLSVNHLALSDENKQIIMRDIFAISSNSLDKLLKKDEDRQLTH